MSDYLTIKGSMAPYLRIQPSPPGDDWNKIEIDLTVFHACIADLRAQLAEAQAQVERAKLRGDGHADTLRAIASMDPEKEGERMRQWAFDGLSGYVEPIESTVKTLSDERNALAALLAESQVREALIQQTLTAVEHEVAQVYTELTNGKFAKCNTEAMHILGAVREAHESDVQAARREGYCGAVESIASTAFNVDDIRIEAIEGDVEETLALYRDAVRVAARREAARECVGIADSRLWARDARDDIRKAFDLEAPDA